MADSRLAFDIVARGGSQAAAELEKVARATDRTGTALKKNAKISDDVAKASARLEKARNAETTALDKVQIAEQRLSEIRGNERSKTSQVLTAEKALAKARRDAAVAGNVAQKAAKDLGKALDNEGKKTGKGIGKSVLHWFTGAGKDFEKAGEKAGKAGGDGILGALTGALKTPVVGPALAVGLIAAVEAVAIPAGAVVATGLVAGAGAGLAAIGLKFAAESERVKQIWAKTATELGAQMRTISKPFEATLLAMSMVAKRTFATFKPELAAAFKSLAPELTAFGDQLGQALGKLAPAIRPLADAFGKVLRTMGPALNDVFTKLSASLTKLAESVSKNPTALADFTTGVGGLTTDLLGLITKLNDANGAFKRLTGISAVTALFDGLKFAAGAVTGPISLLARGVSAFDDLTDKLAGTSHKLNDELSKTSVQAPLAAAGLDAFLRAARGAPAVIESTKTATDRLAEKFDRQTAATQRAIDALNRYSSLLLGDKNAQADYAQSVLDANAAIKENGHTHNLATQAGINNQKALLANAQAAGVQRDAMLKANDGNVKAAASARASQATFVKLAQQMGYTKPQAEAMAKAMIKIPNVTRTAKLQAEKKDLEAKLASAKKQLADKDLTKERRAKLTADIRNAQSGIATIDGMLGNLPKSKTIDIVTRYTTIGSRSSGSGVGGGHVITGKGSAAGGLIPGRPSAIDNHLRPMATGEFVVRASKVRGNLKLLEAINAGAALPSLSAVSRSLAVPVQAATRVFPVSTPSVSQRAVRTASAQPSSGPIELDDRTIVKLAAAIAEATAVRPVVMDGRRLDAALSRRAVGGGY